VLYGWKSLSHSMDNWMKNVAWFFTCFSLMPKFLFWHVHSFRCTIYSKHERFMSFTRKVMTKSEYKSYDFLVGKDNLTSIPLLYLFFLVLNISLILQRTNCQHNSIYSIYVKITTIIIIFCQVVKFSFLHVDLVCYIKIYQKY
jgi:hypothetical protein